MLLFSDAYIVLLCTHYHRFLRIVKVTSTSFLIILLFIKLLYIIFISLQMDHIIIYGSFYQFCGFQFPLEKLFDITRLSVFPLRQHCSISCSADRLLAPIYFRRDYSCLFDIRINQSYFDDSVNYNIEN